MVLVPISSVTIATAQATLSALLPGAHLDPQQAEASVNVIAHGL